MYANQVLHKCVQGTLAWVKYISLVFFLYFSVKNKLLLTMCATLVLSQKYLIVNYRLIGWYKLCNIFPYFLLYWSVFNSNIFSGPWAHFDFADWTPIQVILFVPKKCEIFSPLAPLARLKFLGFFVMGDNLVAFCIIFNTL